MILGYIAIAIWVAVCVLFYIERHLFKQPW